MVSSSPIRTRSSRGGEKLGEYSPTLERVAWFTLRRKGIVTLVWLGAAIGLGLLFPQLESVVREQSVDPIPAGVPSFQTLDRMGASFDERGAKTTVFVVMENSAGLSDNTRDRYHVLVDTLRADDKHVIAVRDLLSDPLTASQALSKDKQAWYLPVGVTGTLGGPDTAEAVAAVRDTAERIFRDTETRVRVTGPPATFSDQLAVGESDLVLITVATVLLIAVILLVVYRSVFTALMPLLVVGMSLAVGRGVLSGLGELGMPVSLIPPGVSGELMV